MLKAVPPAQSLDCLEGMGCQDNQGGMGVFRQSCCMQSALIKHYQPLQHLELMDQLVLLEHLVNRALLE